MYDQSIVLSIDWDFFLWRGSEAKQRRLVVFPGTPREYETSALMLYDWGHNEGHGPALQGVLWLTRYSGFQRCGLDPIEMTGVRQELGCCHPDAFMSALRNRFDLDFGTPVYVADSHAMGYSAVYQSYLANGRRPVRVIHFDAHSDLGYGGVQALRRERAQRICDCGSWLYHALADGFVSHIDLVYPDWIDTDDLEHLLSARHLRRFLDLVTPHFWSDWARSTSGRDLGGVAAVNVARSSAWTPPWFDGMFEALLGQFPRTAVLCLDCEAEGAPGGHDGCHPREWSPCDFQFPGE